MKAEAGQVMDDGGAGWGWGWGRGTDGAGAGGSSRRRCGALPGQAEGTNCVLNAGHGSTGSVHSSERMHKGKMWGTNGLCGSS